MVAPLRLDARHVPLYAAVMTRLLLAVLMFLFAVPLSGCGITGTLKTPPPVWGEDSDENVPGVTDEEEEESDDPFGEDGPGYGIDVTNTP